MKSDSKDWKLPVYLGVLVVVALLINYFFFKKATTRREAKAQEQREAAADMDRRAAAEQLAKKEKESADIRQQAAKSAEVKRIREEGEAAARAEAARQKAIEDAAAEHARYLGRYLNSGFTRKPGVAAIGVAIESEQGTVNHNIATALTQRFKTADVQLFNSFFKPEFVADRFVASIFAGETAIFERLELTNSLNGVLIGRQTVAYSTNTALANTITANLRLELMALPVGMSRENQSWNFAANGVGFQAHEARQAAEDRIIEQIAKNTNMVLVPRF